MEKANKNKLDWFDIAKWISVMSGMFGMMSINGLLLTRMQPHLFKVGIGIAIISMGMVFAGGYAVNKIRQAALKQGEI